MKNFSLAYRIHVLAGTLGLSVELGSYSRRKHERAWQEVGKRIYTSGCRHRIRRHQRGRRGQLCDAPRLPGLTRCSNHAYRWS